MTGRAVQYLLRHWRGELSLGRSYWINGSALGLLTLVVANMAAEFAAAHSLFASALLGMVLILFGLAHSSWAMVGIWRSASRHVQRGGKGVWALLAQVMVIFGAVSLVTALVTRIVPALHEYALIVTGNDPMGRVELQLSRDGSVLLASGGLGQGSADAFSKQLQAAPDVKTVMLESHGGRLREAEQIAQLIRQYSLDTYVEGLCASACTYAFLAGADRAATPNARIGFHRPTFPGFTAADEEVAMQDMRRVYREAGIPDAFTDRVARVPAQRMWYPTHAELLENAVINRTSLGGELVTLGLNTATSVEGVEAALRQAPMFIALEERFPGALNEVLANTRQAIDQQLTDGEVWSAARAVVSDRIPELLTGASDELLESFLALALAQLQALDGLDEQACALYLVARLDAGKTLPPAVLAQEAHWMLQALRTPPRVDEDFDQDAAVRAMELAMESMTAEHVELISQFNAAAEYSSEHCRAMAALYRNVQALPAAERQIALRGLFQDSPLLAD